MKGDKADLHRDTKTGLSKVSEDHPGTLGVAKSVRKKRIRSSASSRARGTNRIDKGDEDTDGEGGRSTLGERRDVQHLVLLDTEFGGAGGGFGRHSDDVA